MPDSSKDTASVSEEVVRPLAAQLGYKKLDTRTFETLSAFASQFEGDVSTEALKKKYLEFEHGFLDLALLKKCDFPVDFTSVSGHMTRDILTVEASEPVVDFSRRILRRMVTGTPVVDKEGRLVGVISASDVVGAVARPELLENIENLTVKDLMTIYPVTVYPTSSVLEVLHILRSFRLHRVIVVDENNSPVGIITSFDLCKLLAKILQELRNQLKK